MNKVQLYEDLGRILYLLCDYTAEESDQYINDDRIRTVLQRSFEEIHDIYEELDGDSGMYSAEDHVVHAS